MRCVVSWINKRERMSMPVPASVDEDALPTAASAASAPMRSSMIGVGLEENDEGASLQHVSSPGTMYSLNSNSSSSGGRLGGGGGGGRGGEGGGVAVSAYTSTFALRSLREVRVRNLNTGRLVDAYCAIDVPKKGGWTRFTSPVVRRTLNPAWQLRLDDQITAGGSSNRRRRSKAEGKTGDSGTSDVLDAKTFRISVYGQQSLRKNKDATVLNHRSQHRRGSIKNAMQKREKLCWTTTSIVTSSKFGDSDDDQSHLLLQRSFEMQSLGLIQHSDISCKRVSNLPFNAIIFVVQAPQGKFELLAEPRVASAVNKRLRDRLALLAGGTPSSPASSSLDSNSKSSSFRNRKQASRRRMRQKKSKKDIAAEAAAAEAAEAEAARAAAEAVRHQSIIMQAEIPSHISPSLSAKYRRGISLCGGDAGTFQKLLDAHCRVREAVSSSDVSRKALTGAFSARSERMSAVNDLAIRVERVRELKDRANVLRQKVKERLKHIDERKTALLSRSEAFARDVRQSRSKRAEKRDDQKAAFREARRMRDKAYSLMRARESQLLTQLCSLLPLHVKEGRRSKRYFIRGLELPHMRHIQLYPGASSSASSSDHNTDVFEEAHIATALGYVCHLVYFLSKYLQVPLRYQPIPQGSSSSIADLVCDASSGPAVAPERGNEGQHISTKSRGVSVFLGSEYRENVHLPPATSQKLLASASSSPSFKTCKSSLNALYKAGLLSLPESNCIGFSSSSHGRKDSSVSRTLSRSKIQRSTSFAESVGTSSSAKEIAANASARRPFPLISPLYWKGVDRASRVHKFFRAYLHLRADIDQLVMTRARFGTLLRMRRKRETTMDKLDEDEGMAACSLLSCRPRAGSVGSAGDARRRSRSGSSFDYPVGESGGAPHIIALLQLLLTYEMQYRM